MFRNRAVVLSACSGALVVITAGALLYVMGARAQPGRGVFRLPRADGASKVNEPLPAYRLMSLERREVAADELRKGRVLIVYLTTGCDACVEEAKIISGVQREAPPGLRIYGVAIERPAQVETFTKEFNLTFPFLIDSGAQLARALDIDRFPSKYLLQDGVITRVWYGTTQDPNELREQLGIK